MSIIRLFLALLSTIGILALAAVADTDTRAVTAYYFAGPVSSTDNDDSLLTDGTAATTACRFAVDARICRLDAAALDVLRRLHAALDDDKDGSVDAAELDGYAREELSQVHSFERVYTTVQSTKSPSRQASKDTVVESGSSSASTSDDSRKGGGKGNALDLWHTWRASEMHNWTVDEVCNWLSAHAYLGHLAPLARQFNIDGPHLPLLTELSSHPAVAPLTQSLSARDRRKLSIRATDLVLFGPPAKVHNPLKDFLTVFCLFVSLGVAWVVWTQVRLTDGQRRRVFAELVSLQNAEKSLGDLQDKLTMSEQQREHDRAERLRLEDEYQREIDNLKAEAGRLSSQRLNTTETDLAEKLRLAEQEVCQLRAALETESHRRPASASVSPELCTLLQLTWESELRYCRQNWQQAELRLAKASEGLERLRRKQNSVIGVLRGAFNSAEMVGTFEMSIAEAKEFADKVKLDVSERMQRWARIEELMGFDLQQQTRTEIGTLQPNHAATTAAAAAVGGSTLRHRGNQFHRRNLSHDATVPAHLAGSFSSAALRLLDSELDLQQHCVRRRLSAKAADVPSQVGNGLSLPKASAVGFLAAGAGGAAAATGSSQPGPSAAAPPAQSDESDSELRHCQAQFHVPEGPDDDTDSSGVPLKQQKPQPVGSDAGSSRPASLISAVQSNHSAVGDSSNGGKAKTSKGSRMAIRALSIFTSRAAKRRKQQGSN